MTYKMQGGVKNYLGNQKMVRAPLKWRSGPQHPSTELAYITKKEKDLLVKHDLHNSLKGGVNRGPSGIMSLNGWGSEDSSQNVSGAAASAAETGSRDARDRAQVQAEFSPGPSGPELPPGVDPVTPQTALDFRAAAINAGAGQRVNPGFFDSRTRLSPNEIALAKAYRNDPNNRFAKRAYRNTGQGGILNMLRRGGFFGNLLRGVGQKFGWGKRYDEPTEDMSEFNKLTLGGVDPFANLDIRDKWDRRKTEEDDTVDFGETVGPKPYSYADQTETRLPIPRVYASENEFIDWDQGTKADGIPATNAFNNSDSFANWNVNDEALYP